MDKEVWKDIKGYEGLYQASSFGRVKGLDRYVDSHNQWKRYKIFIKGKILSFGKDGDGYYNFILTKNGVHKNKKGHRLVAQAFIPNIKNKPSINHKNSNRADNRIKNLEWCTQKENQKHAMLVGNSNPLGETNNNAKLKEKDVIKIKKELLNYKTGDCTKIAKKYNVSFGMIGHIKNNKNWGHIHV